MSKKILVGKMLQHLQQKIAEAYPPETKIKILGIVIEATEPGKPTKKVVLGNVEA